MGKRLAIILGAGASHDAVPPNLASVRGEYRPPVTKDLFAFGNPVLEAMLEKYPGALALAAEIRLRCNRGEPLEAVLRSLNDSTEEHIARQFRQVPFYLQELIGECSDQFTRNPVNYNYLVSQVLKSDFDKVAFITLNYDLLLEKALRSFTGVTIGKLGAYVQHEKWMLIKLHGSVNWATRVVNGMGGHPRDLEGVFGVLVSLQLDQHIEGRLELIDHHGARFGGQNGKDLFYPALAIPVEGKYEYVCPDEHVAALKTFLSSCQNFLVVGTSGNDRDLLELLQGSVTHCSNYAIVGKGEDDVEATFKQIRASAPVLGATGAVYGTEGFSGFTRDKQLDEFLSGLATE